MNANELAEIIQHLENAKYVGASKASTMLRQQQAEIEALKLQLHTTLTNRDLRTYDGKTEINNEPVAWMSVELDGRTVLATYEFETAIPLYTHPAKTLTDKEILELWDWDSGEILATDLLDFADAILRKAQEK